MLPIGVVRSPYTDTSQIPKGLGATHVAEGVLEIVPEFERLYPEGVDETKV